MNSPFRNSGDTSRRIVDANEIVVVTVGVMSQPERHPLLVALFLALRLMVAKKDFIIKNEDFDTVISFKNQRISGWTEYLEFFKTYQDVHTLIMDEYVTPVYEKYVKPNEDDTNN